MPFWGFYPFLVGVNYRERKKEVVCVSVRVVYQCLSGLHLSYLYVGVCVVSMCVFLVSMCLVCLWVQHCVCVCVCVCMHACVRVLVCFERTRETEFLSTELNALERKKVGLSEMESSKKTRFFLESYFGRKDLASGDESFSSMIMSVGVGANKLLSHVASCLRATVGAQR